MTIGDEEVIDHQRLSGAGYCFSASAPPFVSSASIASVNILREEGPAIVKSLRRNTKLFIDAVRGIKGIEVDSDPRSPLVFMVLSDEYEEEEVSKKKARERKKKA